MLIRSYVHSDLSRLIELTIEAFGPFYEDSFRPLVGETVFAIQHGNWRDDYRKLVAGLHAPDEHKYVAVAEENDVPVGYVAWAVDPARRHGTITILAVAAEHRRENLGTALCEHAFDAMRKQGAVMVEIGTGGDDFHAPARAFYERLGCIQLPLAVYFRNL
jgi:ribosomal protein S18 acetylase RimI-like enzyme